MDKIQFSEECAIIPLTRFNELKANELLLQQGLNEKFYCVKQEIYYEPAPSNTYRSTKFFASYEWEITRKWQERENDLTNEPLRLREVENKLLRQIKELEIYISTLKKKKWYQFIPV